MDPLLVMPVQDTTGRLDNLSVSPTPQFSRLGTASWMIGKLLDATKDSPNKSLCRLRVIQRNVISDGFEIAQRRLGPDYFSHRAMRCLA